MGEQGRVRSRDPYAPQPRAVCAVTIMVRWHVRDFAARAARLARSGFAVDAGGRVRFAGGSIALVEALGPGLDLLELLEMETQGAPAGAAEVADAPIPAHPNGLATLIAVGWATVDLERAASDAGIDPAQRLELAPDRALGARAVLLESGPVVLLEPDTEGRIAASLARFGEGPAAIYLAAGDGGIPSRAAPPASGPFGRSAVMEQGDLQGPFLVACDGRLVASTTIPP